MRRLALVALAALLASAGCGADGMSGDDRTSALREGPRLVERLLSYSAADLDADVEEVGVVATARFADEFATLLKGEAGDRIRDRKVESTAEVTHAGVVRERAQGPVLLVFVRQTTSMDGEITAGDKEAVEVALERHGDGWRITRLDRVAPVRVDTLPAEGDR